VHDEHGHDIDASKKLKYKQITAINNPVFVIPKQCKNTAQCTAIFDRVQVQKSIGHWINSDLSRDMYWLAP
jgi:hypothetical protein